MGNEGEFQLWRSLRSSTTAWASNLLRHTSGARGHQQRIVNMVLSVFAGVISALVCRERAVAIGRLNVWSSFYVG